MKSTKIHSKGNIAVGLMVLALMIGLAFSNNQTRIEQNHTEDSAYSHASWAWVSETPSQMVEQADIICLGTVAGSYTVLIDDLVFTRNIVEFNDVYLFSKDLANSEHADSIRNAAASNDVSVQIELQQTGGVYQEHRTRPFADDPLLEVGKTYLMFLKMPYKGYSHYHILGGHQGVADVVDGQIIFTHQIYDFSSLNVRLQNFINTVEELGFDKSKCIVNSNNKQLDAFILDSLSMDKSVN